MTLVSELVSNCNDGTCRPELKRKETLKGQLRKKRNPNKTKRYRISVLSIILTGRASVPKNLAFEKWKSKIVSHFLCVNLAIH